MTKTIHIVRRSDHTEVYKRTPENASFELLYAVPLNIVLALAWLLTDLSPIWCLSLSLLLTVVAVTAATGWRVSIRRDYLEASCWFAGYRWAHQRFSLEEVVVTPQWDWDGFDWVTLHGPTLDGSESEVVLDAWHDMAAVANVLRDELSRVRDETSTL